MVDGDRRWRGQTGPSRRADLPAHERGFEWFFRGTRQRLRLSIPAWLLAYYAGRPRTLPYPAFVADPFDRDLIGSIARRVRGFAARNDLSPAERIHFAAAFVQSLEYVSDSLSTSYSDYHRFPVETLAYRGGDCEDSSILLAALLSALGEDVALVVLRDHVLVGVATPDGETAGEAFYAVDGRRYFVLETTDTGWRLGQCPSRYEGEPAEVFPLGRQPALTHRFRAVESGGTADLRVDVTNLGDRAAEAVDAVVTFEDASGSTAVRRPLGDGARLAPNATRRLRGAVSIPDEPLRATARVRVAGRLWDESAAGWAPSIDDG